MVANVTVDLLGMADRLPSGSGRIGLRQAVEGAASTSCFAPSTLTQLRDEARRRNNEAA